MIKGYNPGVTYKSHQDDTKPKLHSPPLDWEAQREQDKRKAKELAEETGESWAIHYHKYMQENRDITPDNREIPGYVDKLRQLAEDYQYNEINQTLGYPVSGNTIRSIIGGQWDEYSEETIESIKTAMEENLDYERQKNS